MTDSRRIAYHLSELKIAQLPSDKDYILPAVTSDDQCILDVGCGIGQTLVGLNLDDSHALSGIDIEPDALAYGKAHFDDIHFSQARAEQLPFGDDSFDMVFSRVALPYTHIPNALNEMHRVLEPGGKLWLSLHTFEFTLQQLRDSIMKRKYKDIVYRCYVITNSVLHLSCGKTFRFPFNTERCESFQTVKSMRKELLKRGFIDIDIKRGKHFEVIARKAPDVELKTTHTVHNVADTELKPADVATSHHHDAV